jgi:hypothetical protein
MRSLGLVLVLATVALLSAACSKGHGGAASNYVYTTPTPPPAAAVLDRAGPLCDAAFHTRATGAATAQAPAFELLELDESQLDPSAFHDENLNQWIADNSPEITGVPTPLLAATPDAAHALVCVIMRQVQVGTFEISGSAAIRIDYDTRLLSWPDGALVAAQSFRGAAPPADRTVSSACRGNSDVNGCKNPVYGASPASDLGAWLQQQLGATH